MMEILSLLAFLLACIGLPLLGVTGTHLFWYLQNKFPWQLRIQLLEEELQKKSQAVQSRDDELKQIRDRLLDALDNETK